VQVTRLEGWFWKKDWEQGVGAGLGGAALPVRKDWEKGVGRGWVVRGLEKLVWKKDWEEGVCGGLRWWGDASAEIVLCRVRFSL
jgi:hypothetical protein